uniref:GTP-binding protein n=1 Tax=Rhabditophanes sp. KR3021 TaxID=114890 RepID=A0AC35UHL9_9BILA
MGRSCSGKTSMRSVIFANYIARDTSRLGATIDVEHAHVKFLGNLVLHLWDCGGQEVFMENFLNAQKDQIFKGVQVLIYVFDIDSKDEKDFEYYSKCVASLMRNSPTAKVFVLLHKIDLIPPEIKDQVYREKVNKVIASTKGMPDERLELLRQCCFMSSIWDETLYKAWSAIVHLLIPSIDIIEKHLMEFAKIMEASEVLLFEKATFLSIAKAEVEHHDDLQRFEKLSNIIKQFKLSVSRIGSHFECLEIRNRDFACFIDSFTENTFIMVVVPDGNVSSATILMNIKSVKRNFESLTTAAE